MTTFELYTRQIKIALSLDYFLLFSVSSWLVRDPLHVVSRSLSSVFVCVATIELSLLQKNAKRRPKEDKCLA